MKNLKICLWLGAMLICSFIQWHGHYLKGEVSFWLDIVMMTIISMALVYFTFKS